MLPRHEIKMCDLLFELKVWIDDNFEKIAKILLQITPMLEVGSLGLGKFILVI